MRWVGEAGGAQPLAASGPGQARPRLPHPAAALPRLVAAGCLSVEQARRAIRWEIILVIAASLGVSTGMETSGASGGGRRWVGVMCCCMVGWLWVCYWAGPAQDRGPAASSTVPTTPPVALPCGEPPPPVFPRRLPTRAAAIANGLVDIGRKAGGQGFIIVGGCANAAPGMVRGMRGRVFRPAARTSLHGKQTDQVPAPRSANPCVQPSTPPP